MSNDITERLMQVLEKHETLIRDHDKLRERISDLEASELYLAGERDQLRWELKHAIPTHLLSKNAALVAEINILRVARSDLDKIYKILVPDD